VSREVALDHEIGDDDLVRGLSIAGAAELDRVVALGRGRHRITRSKTR